LMFVYDLGLKYFIKSLGVLKHNFMVCCIVFNRDYYACGTYPVES